MSLTAVSRMIRYSDKHQQLAASFVDSGCYRTWVSIKTCYEFNEEVLYVAAGDVVMRERRM